MAIGKSALKQVVRDAFFATHEGRSPDDVVIDEELNRRFVQACQGQVPSVNPFDCNWLLYNLRKESGLGRVCSSKQRATHRDYLHAAEIAARQMEDKYNLTMDRVLCHPEYRKEFDIIAQSIAPDVRGYLLRKAALGLRKSRKLKPELIKRIADWGKTVTAYPADQLWRNLELIPCAPGVYVFRDRSGYLYIGEAANLRSRVAKHLDHSDRKALARYFWSIGTEDLWVELHSFSSHSNGNKKQFRRAYESDLIRSRRPKFNIQS